MTALAPLDEIAVTAVGETALRALTLAGGLLAPIPGFAEAPYRLAGQTVVWLGARPRVLHPRMIAVSRAPPPGASFRLAVPTVAPWRPAPLPTLDTASFKARVAALARTARTIEPPRGFGALLYGRLPAFPLDLGVPRVSALAEAVAADDPRAIEAAALRLLGFGTGLTPSGDDLVGGLLFARRVLGMDAAWDALAARLASAACERTHTISAALFADLAAGASYAWLHDLVAALATDDASADATAAARSLLAVGHSSGWDMLTGFVLGCTGTLKASPS